MLLEPPACAETRRNVFPGQERCFGCYRHGVVDGLNPHQSYCGFPRSFLLLLFKHGFGSVADNGALQKTAAKH